MMLLCEETININVIEFIKEKVVTSLYAIKHDTGTVFSQNLVVFQLNLQLKKTLH